MKIEELVSSLDELSSWRKKELLQARFLAESKKNKEARPYLCRVWVLIMYAHCDNFLKEAARNYLKYLRDNFGSISHYRHELMWLVIHGKENLMEANQKYKSLNDYFNSNENLYFDEKLVKSLLDKGSFSYKLLRYCCDWVMQIQFNHAELVDFCDRLKNKRDNIAHGEEVYIESSEDCIDWHNKTIHFIDSLKEAIIENAYKVESW